MSKYGLFRYILFKIIDVNGSYRFIAVHKLVVSGSYWFKRVHSGSSRFTLVPAINALAGRICYNQVGGSIF